MNALRALLLMLLTCAVPATALAGATHQGLCERGAPAAAATDDTAAMHAGHAMHGDHAAADAGSADEPLPASACQCGCSCAGIAHCAATAGVSVADAGAALPFGGALPCPPMHCPGHALSGFSSDVLRPPSLS